MPNNANTPAKPAPSATVAPDAAKPVDREALRNVAASTFTRLHAQHGGSIAIKPLAAFKPKPVTAKFMQTAVTERACAAVAAAFLANGDELADGATTKRQFTLDGAEYCIENGGLKRAVLCGLVTVNNGAGTIKLRPGAVAAMQALIGPAIKATAKTLAATPGKST